MSQAALMRNIRPSNRLDSQNALNELIMLHDKGILTDDEFRKLVRIISSEYIETELTRRITDSFETLLRKHISQIVYGR